jgi:16S rRNA A1518/A1519 N6-dimethyltransferase RsmA/KsgA/DIM1 with predicted DNA glycosylase/AP lyase activity
VEVAQWTFGPDPPVPSPVTVLKDNPDSPYKKKQVEEYSLKFLSRVNDIEISGNLCNDF